MECYRRKFILASIVYLILHFAVPSATNQLTEEQKQLLKNLHDNCVAETSITEDVIEAASKGNFPDDKKLKCYMKCLMTSIGVMDDDGTMDFEAYLEILPEHLKEWGQKTADKCRHIIPEGDACETAFKINVCSYEVDPKIYKLF